MSDSYLFVECFYNIKDKGAVTKRKFCYSPFKRYYDKSIFQAIKNTELHNSSHNGLHTFL